MRARLSTPHGRFAVAAAALLALVVGSGLVVTTRYACGCAATAPEAARWPAVTGAATVGSTLSTDNGTWVSSGDLYPNTSYAYQWLTCTNSTSLASCSNATGSGATSSIYTIASADVGDYLRALVTATNAGGSTSQASATTAVVTGGGSQPTNFSTSTILSGSGASGQCCSLGTFQSQSPRGVVSGGDIFLGLMTSWSSSGSPDVQSVYMSSNNGVSWSDLVDVGCNSCQAPSLVVDSHGDVYAFMDSYDGGCTGTCPSGSFTAGGTRMYMFPAGNFSNVSYLDLGDYPHCGCARGFDKTSAGYDPNVGGTYGQAYDVQGDSIGGSPVYAVNLNSATSASGDSLATAYVAATTASTDDGDQELADYPHYDVAQDGSGDVVMAWTDEGCGSLMGVSAGNCYSSTNDYVNDRMIYSTNNGSTWYGYCSGTFQQLGTAGCGPNFSTTNGSSTGFPTDDAYSLLSSSELCSSPCSTNAYHWMGATWLQDGWFLATIGPNGGPLTLKRFNLNTQTQATEQGGANGVCSSDASPICIDQIGGSGGDLFSGSGGANARIFLTGVDGSGHLGTIYSDDDGATWHNWVLSSSTYSSTYALSGSAQLSNGEIFGAWGGAQSATSITFFHTS